MSLILTLFVPMNNLKFKEYINGSSFSVYTWILFLKYISLINYINDIIIQNRERHYISIPIHIVSVDHSNDDNTEIQFFSHFSSEPGKII